MEEYLNYLINVDSIISDALKKFNNPKINSTLFVIDKHRKLLGSITEGDIRRGMLKGARIDDSIIDHFEKNVHYIRSNNYDYNIIKEFSLKFKVIPVTDDHHRIVDIIDFKKQKQGCQ